MKVIIKNFSTSGRNFTIVFEQEHYLAIEDKYIDREGKLNTSLNGIQMYAAKTLRDCCKHVEEAVHMDMLLNSGYTKAQAFCIFNNIPYTKKLESLFNERVSL